MNLVLLLLILGACCWAGFELRQQRLLRSLPPRNGGHNRIGRVLFGPQPCGPQPLEPLGRQRRGLRSEVLSRPVPDGGEALFHRSSRPENAARTSGPLDQTQPLGSTAQPPLDQTSDETVAIGYAELIGPSADQRLILSAGVAPMTVGRRDATILLRQPTVSARHAEFAYDGRTWTLFDLRSTNGTFVNGRRIDTIVLGAGDKICFGEDGPSFHFFLCQ